MKKAKKMKPMKKMAKGGMVAGPAKKLGYK